MDYLNYGKQQQKPQPKEFGKDVQLTQDDFTFGDLGSTQKLVPPPAKFETPASKDELMGLFPVPLGIFQYPFDYKKELEFIKSLPTREKESPESIQRFNRQSKDTFILDRPEMSRVKQFIESKLKEFVVKIVGSDSEMVITQSWSNRNAKNESHHEHTHPNSIISGVWYPQINEQLPPIEFRNPNSSQIALGGTRYNQFNSGIYSLPLKNGELLIFPSNLIHSVPVNTSDMERISLSFNTWCKGDLGDKESLTYVPFDRCV
jgi:uncharacterized protein (TIGR02466 family)